jgi:hypothetical protein
LNASPIGSLAGWFVWRAFRFNGFGHQSRFDLPRCALLENGQFWSLLIDVDLSK